MHQLTSTASVSKHQLTCRLNASSNTSMHQSINLNQLVGLTHQLVRYCVSLHCTSIQRNQYAKASAVHWVRWIPYYE